VDTQSFVVIERERQSQFRRSSRTISPAGRAANSSTHEFLLAPGCQKENLSPRIRDEAVEFFRDRDIKWWQSTRSGDNFETSGPTHNMMSSQVACVNFLFPLANSESALVSVLKTIDKDVECVLPIRCGDVESLVEFEWVGSETSLEGERRTRGRNVTSADALMIGGSKGRHRAFLFEWKYVERYENDKSLAEGDSGRKRLGRYQSL
jgi:hypothetical protein